MKVCVRFLSAGFLTKARKMSKQYVYTEGGYVHVLPEGTVIWNEAGDQNTSQYFDANNTIINDCTINESFNTAIGSDNETQYLSILESDAAELTLEDLSNLTIGKVFRVKQYEILKVQS